MRPECMTAVATALGRAITQAEAKDIEQRVTNAARTLARQDPQAWLGKSQADRLTEAGQFAAQQIEGEAALKQKRAALSVAAHARLAQTVADGQARGLTALDALERMVAVHADGKLNAQSVESASKAISRDALRQMIDTLTASNPKWFGLFENKDGITALVREIFGEDSGNADARAGAEAWRNVSAGLRERFNRSGGDIGQLEDWGMPHHHSQLRVAKAGREAWVNDVLPRLNRDAYFNPDGTRMNDAQLVEFLGNAWLTIATGGANKLTPGQPKGNGMRANRGNASREIHFRSADDYLAYQESFGERSLYEVLTGHVEGVSKDIALVEAFGPNPDAAFRLLRDQAVQSASVADPTKVGKIAKDAARAENLYNFVAGKTQPVASEALARGFDTLRNWLTASRLGSAVISSLSDESTLYLTAHLNRLPASRVLANELAALNPANKMEERMANRAGLALNTMIATLNRFGQDSLGASFSSKLSSTVMRVQGLNAITEARRRAFGVTMMDSIGAVVREHPNLAALDAADHRILLSKGITDTDFAVWKAATPEDWGNGNRTMLTPESIYRIPDASLAKLGDPRALKEQAVTKLLGAVLDETDIAVIEPGAKERAMMGSGLQRGTWKGELTRSFFLFKSFPLAMITRHWARGMSMPTGTGRAAYLASLMATTTLLGALTMQVREVLNGRDPRNLDPTADGGARNWMKAMLQGGSLGLYGDFLFSETSLTGRSVLASALGPVASTADELIALTQGNAMQAMQGKETNIGAESVRLLKGNLPGASLWYTKAALDHLIWHRLAEYFSPGYLAQMRARAQREFGQSYYWEPGETTPERAPDLGAIAGE